MPQEAPGLTIRYQGKLCAPQFEYSRSVGLEPSHGVVFMELDIGCLPIERPATNLIYSMSSRNVRHVLIDGRFVLLNGRTTLVDEKDLAAEYAAALATVNDRLGRA